MSDFAKLMSELLASELEHMPILVTRAEVLDHFAKKMDLIAECLRHGASLSERQNQDEIGRAMTAVWKAKLPAADLQISAASTAAELLRHLAREDRILAARAAAEQANKEPTRG